MKERFFSRENTDGAKAVLTSADITVKESITKVDVSDLDMPVVGRTPDLTVTQLSNGHYHVATYADFEEEGTIDKDSDPEGKAIAERGFAWFHYYKGDEGDTFDYYIEPMYLGEKFVANEEYSFVIYYVADEGYQFANNRNCQTTINKKTSLVDPESPERTGKILAVFSTPQTPSSMPAPSTVSVKLYGYDDVYTSWSKVSGARVYCKAASDSDYTYKGSTDNIYEADKP